MHTKKEDLIGIFNRIFFEHKLIQGDFKYCPKIHVKSIKKERYLRKLKQRKRQGKIKK